MSIVKDNRTEEEVQKDIQLLGQKPEIDTKVNFYKNTLLACEEMYNSIDDRISKGYTTEKRTFLFIFRVVVKKMLDALDIAELKLKKIELEAEVKAKQSFYEMWLKRSKEYDARFEEISRECNEKFEETLERAKEIASKGQLRLQQTIKRYEEEELTKKHDQKDKNDFYMYMRKEITNHINYKGQKPQIVR